VPAPTVFFTVDAQAQVSSISYDVDLVATPAVREDLAELYLEVMLIEYVPQQFFELLPGEAV
jgi:hypothetical protein